MQSYIVFQLQMLEGLTGEAQDEIVITYPNGGETLETGEKKNIEWKSLGTNLTDKDSEKFVELFISNETEPEQCPSNDEIWTSISSGKINNSYTAGEATGTPKDIWEWTVPEPDGAEADSVWLRICGSNSDGASDCTKDICDMSRSWFTIKKEGIANSLSDLNRGRPKKKRASKGREY